MREFWAFIMICATVFASFATAMLVVILRTGWHGEVSGVTTAMVVAGWALAYLAWRALKAIPRKNTDIW
jgi:protein-S-isoprenylcysteine O-methyltransferase Ste14